MDDPANRSDADNAVTPSGRLDPRDSLLLTARLRMAGAKAERPVRIRNLSAGGVMAEATGPISADGAVEIHIRGLEWVKGHVVWIAEGRIGIAFDRPVDPIAVRKPVVAPEPRRIDKPIRSIF